jgi:hypothetical protein
MSGTFSVRIFARRASASSFSAAVSSKITCSIRTTRLMQNFQFSHKSRQKECIFIHDSLPLYQIAPEF